MPYPYPCPGCADGYVHLVTKAGRKGTYDGVEFDIPDFMALPTCTGCGQEWLDARMTALLDEIGEKATRDRRRHVYRCFPDETCTKYKPKKSWMEQLIDALERLG